MKYFCDFSRCLTSTRSIGKFNFIKFHGCKMTEKWPKTSIKSQELYSHRTIGAMGLSPLSRVTRRRFSNEYYGFSIPWQ